MIAFEVLIKFMKIENLKTSLKYTLSRLKCMFFGRSIKDELCIFSFKSELFIEFKEELEILKSIRNEERKDEVERAELE